MKKEVPDEIEERLIATGSYRLASLLVETGLAASKGDAKRLIEQGGVRVDGEKVAASSSELSIANGDSILLQAGKLRFLRITAE